MSNELKSLTRSAVLLLGGLLGCLAAGSAVGAGAAAPPSPPPPQSPAPSSVPLPAILPLDEVRPGMTGYGLTVFSGTRVDTFEVRVLGVQRNQRADGSVILVELSGPGLAEAAIPEGMSGSPVFLDGKLAGAVAFGWEGSLRPIGGLTPAAELLAVPTAPAAPTAAMGGGAGSSPPSLRAALDPLGRGAELAGLLWGGAAAGGRPGAGGGAGAAGGTTGGTVAGLAGRSAAERWPDPAALAAGLLAGGELAPAADSGLRALPAALVGRALGEAGAARAGAPAPRAGEAPAAVPTLAPGSACAVSLLRGDAELGAIGTVTWVAGDDVWLLGHPLLQAGPVELPLATAEVFGLLPNRGMSFKLGTVGQTVGAVHHDLRAGAGGRLGAGVATVPVAVTIARPTGEERYAFEAAPERRLLPALVYWCLYNALLARGDDLSQQTIRYRIETAWREGGRARPPLVLTGVLAGPGSAAEVAPEWAGPVQILLESRHTALTLAGVDARLEVEPGGGAAAIVAVDGPAAARPGERLALGVTLRPRRGEAQRREVAFALPATLPPGEYRLLAASARDVFALEAERAADLFADRSLEATWEVLARPRSAASLELVLYAPPDGLTVDGRELPALPPGVAAALAGGGTGRVGDTRAGIAARLSLPGREALSGAAVLPLTILPPRPTVPREERP